MKKIFSLILIIITVMLLTVSCSKDENKITSPEKNTENSFEPEPNFEPVTLIEGTCNITVIAPEGASKTIPCDTASLSGKGSLFDALLSAPLVKQIEPKITKGEKTTLDSIIDLQPDISKNEYIAIFTSDEDYSESNPEIIGEYKVFEVSKGVDEIILSPGEVYILMIKTK